MVHARTALAQSDTLRLVWPQWQGAGQSSVRNLLPELPHEEARDVYALGTRVLTALLPEHTGPTEIVPVSDEPADEEARVTEGAESRAQVLAGIRDAQEAIAHHDAPRILTLGGDCSVSVAPFTELAARYGQDLAVVWIDSHPDIGTAHSRYPGYHAMAVSHIIGSGDREVLDELAAFVSPTRVALAGLHSWTEDDYPNIAKWGLHAFSPADLRESTTPLLTWLESTGCSRVAIHLDVGTVDADEVRLRLGYDRGGLSMAQTNRVIKDLGQAADVVGLTIAEYVPRQVVALTHLLEGLPLL
ncbi:arginase family protein [Actinomyces viscosus]|uniref:arginase family protein n=1 Tax=Actinomyces viscosus TaxID=1656 RepID=UPI0028EA4CDF|nr:arginase family protein [Actinomyces viscosus]